MDKSDGQSRISRNSGMIVEKNTELRKENATANEGYPGLTKLLREIYYYNENVNFIHNNI